MTTGQKIQKLRKDKKMTQEAFADQLQVSRQSVSKWESDVAYPETDKLIDIATLFDVSVDYLLKDSAQGQLEKGIRKQVQRYKMFTCICLLIALTGMIAGISSIYISNSCGNTLKWLGILLISFFDIGSLIFYIVVRSDFIADGEYDEEDKMTIRRNTNAMIVTLIVTVAAFLPLVALPTEGNYSGIFIGGVLTFWWFLVYAAQFAAVALLIALFVILLRHLLVSKKAPDAVLAFCFPGAAATFLASAIVFMIVLFSSDSAFEDSVIFESSFILGVVLAGVIFAASCSLAAGKIGWRFFVFAIVAAIGAFVGGMTYYMKGAGLIITAAVIILIVFDFVRSIVKKDIVALLICKSIAVWPLAGVLFAMVPWSSSRIAFAVIFFSAALLNLAVDVWAMIFRPWSAVAEISAKQ